MKKDSQLTESRLEALSSAHQLHTLRETVASLRTEMSRLKTENERIYQSRTGSSGVNTPEISPRKYHSNPSTISNNSNRLTKNISSPYNSKVKAFVEF